MLCIFATIQIKPGFADKFSEASFGFARDSVRDELGCFRFDVLQDSSDPNRFHLYEVFEDDAALQAHATTPHFKEWIGPVRDWFDGKIQRVDMTAVFPSDDGWRRQKPHLVDS